ncbi:type II toxin-antitoxin system RelE/ParE family toxin [uncultured Herbaspirillum sp.]|uniref:type II toxin-antitoxin system RelE/ParE family toxin n=1 Tax=uncultured Herbaspirillum sp. TaxID=160236 RepID=UPI00258C74C2|nr:type II toxin-antitoxin system RelE/ParE family toxin [uncultured Herbaspirillum sp.]
MILRWLPMALHDRDALIDYIAQHSLRAAIDQGDKIEDQLLHLVAHPLLGRAGRIHGTRELVIGGTPFIAVYRYRPRQRVIEVMRLLHGAQQWPPVED